MITCCCVKIYVLILLIILALIPVAIIFIYNPELLGSKRQNNEALNKVKENAVKWIIKQ